MNNGAAQMVGEHIRQMLNEKAGQGAFSMEFAAARSYGSLISRDDISGLLVNVLAWVSGDRLVARDRRDVLVTLNVEIAMPLGGDEVAECDQLALLMEQLGDAVISSELPQGIMRIMPEEEFPLFAPQFEPELIAQERLYFGVISMRFAVNRGLGNA